MAELKNTSGGNLEVAKRKIYGFVNSIMLQHKADRNDPEVAAQFGLDAVGYAGLQKLMGHQAKDRDIITRGIPNIAARSRCSRIRSRLAS
jgi:hypothetical protein